MQQLGHLGGDFTKGALKENIEETADGLVSAIAKAVGTGHSVQQAVGDYIKQIPENAIVTSLVGGGGEAIPAAGESTVRRPPGQTAATPPAPQQHSAAAVAAPATQHPIPDATTPNTTGSAQQPSTTANNSQPSSTPPAALPVPTFEQAGTAKETIDKLKAQKGPLSPDQQQTLDAAEKTFARRTEDNILKQQAGIEKRGGKLHPTTAKALEAARATLARPRPEGNTDSVGTPDKTTSSTASSSGPLPPADTATTQGVTPPAGISTGTRTSTANADGTTVTASSGATTSPGGGTHTTNGVAAPPVGYGNRIPEDTTHPEHIDLATRRVENLEKIARKRPLDPHEQGIYDNALRVRDRNTPAQPGDRNNPLPQGRRNSPNPQDLVMAGGDAPISQTQSAAANAPPPAAPAQPANAIGSTINGPSTANPDAPHASANDGLGSSRPPPAAPQQQPLPQGESPTNSGASSNVQPIPSPAHVGNSWNSNIGTTPFSTPADTTAEPEWLPASPEAQEAKFRLNQPTINAINKLLYEEGKQPQAPNSARESRSLLESTASHIGGSSSADSRTQGSSLGAGSGMVTGQSASAVQGTSKPVNAKESRKALLDWAASNGLLITKWPSRWNRNGPEDHGGKEHHSFPINVGGQFRWVKATKGNGSSFGFRPQDNGRDWSLAPKATAQEYIERLIHANRWGDDVHLHGVYHNPQTGEVSIITSQEHAAKSETLTEDDLVNAMSKAGFHTAGNL